MYTTIFSKFLKEIENEKTVVITAHINSDPDAIASALTMGYLLERENFEVHYCIDGVSRISKKVLRTLGLGIDILQETRGEAVIVCDTPSLELLGKCSKVVEESTTLVIDHHAPGSLQRYAKYYIRAGEPATSIIVADIAYSLLGSLPRPYATLLITGILYDTKRLTLATEKTFNVLSKLVSEGDYSLAQRLLEEEPEYSERVARLKGAARASIVDVCGYLVVITRVSAYEASVARALIGLGADVAIVVGGHKGSIRVSVRISRRLSEKGLRGDTIMKRVSELLGGVGGGHAAASGYNAYAGSKGEGDRRRVMVGREVLVEFIREILSSFC